MLPILIIRHGGVTIQMATSSIIAKRHSRVLGFVEFGFGYVLATIYIPDLAQLSPEQAVLFVGFLGGLIGSSLAILDPVAPLIHLVVNIFKPKDQRVFAAYRLSHGSKGEELISELKRHRLEAISRARYGAGSPWFPLVVALGGPSTGIDL